MGLGTMVKILIGFVFSAAAAVALLATVLMFPWTKSVMSASSNIASMASSYGYVTEDSINTTINTLKKDPVFRNNTKEVSVNIIGEDMFGKSLYSKIGDIAFPETQRMQIFYIEVDAVYLLTVPFFDDIPIDTKPVRVAVTVIPFNRDYVATGEYDVNSGITVIRDLSTIDYAGNNEVFKEVLN